MKLFYGWKILLHQFLLVELCRGICAFSSSLPWSTRFHKAPALDLRPKGLLRCFDMSPKFQTSQSLSKLNVVTELSMISQQPPKIGIQNLASTMFAVQDRILTFGLGPEDQDTQLEVLTDQSSPREDSKPTKTVVVGVGPAGLATAIMLARRGWSNITIFDKLPRPPLSGSKEWGDPERSYNIGLDIKGQNALKTLDVWDRVDQHCADVKGRMDWIPGSNKPQQLDFIQKFGYSIKVIQRDCLAGCLLEEIHEKYADKITVHYDVECQQVEWQEDGNALLTMLNKTSAKLQNPGNFQIETPFLVGADGANSAVRSSLVKSSSSDVENTVDFVKYVDDNQRVYKTISLEIPKNLRDDLDYSAVCLDDIIIDALPLKGRRAIGVVLFRPNNQRILQAQTGKEVHDLFAEYFPMFLPFLTEEACDAFARKPVHNLPTFQHCGPIIHRSNTTVLLGDAIHTVKPFFGFGINTALDDIFWLDQCLEASTLKESLVQFSEKRGHEAVAIVEISRALDRPGLTGLCNFFLPMMLDKVFEYVLPGVFAPNLLTYLRAPGVSFCEARSRKRMDHAAQLSLMTAQFAWGAYAAKTYSHFLTLKALTSHGFTMKFASAFFISMQCILGWSQQLFEEKYIIICFSKLVGRHEASERGKSSIGSV